MSKAPARATKWPSFEAVGLGSECHLKDPDSTVDDSPVYRNAKLLSVSGPEGHQTATFFVEGVGTIPNVSEVNFEAWSRHSQ